MDNLKPSKGKYSKRSNEKRSYWLKNRIYHYVNYKAYEYGIKTSRVSPVNTSRLCCYCDSKVYRHGDGEIPVEYKCGCPLFTCTGNITHKGNADLNAARNVGRKFFKRYDMSLNLIPKASKEMQRCSSGLNNRRVGLEEQASGTAIFHPPSTTAPMKPELRSIASVSAYTRVE